MGWRSTYLLWLLKHLSELVDVGYFDRKNFVFCRSTGWLRTFSGVRMEEGWIIVFNQETRFDWVLHRCRETFIQSSLKLSIFSKTSAYAEEFVYQIVNGKQWIKHKLRIDLWHSGDRNVLRTLGDRSLREFRL